MCAGKAKWWKICISFYDRFYEEGDTNYQNPPNSYSDYTTLPPYPYYQYQPEEPHDPYNTPATKSPPNYYYNVYSTTKSPYNFESFGKQSTSSYYGSEQTPSTKNPYVGNYYQLIQQTTKSPYDFANFGQTTKNPYTMNYHDNINNNYLKRSYNSASYYGDSSNTRNVTANFNNRRFIGG